MRAVLEPLRHDSGEPIGHGVDVDASGILFDTRKTCVSTAITGSWNAKFAVTSALLRPMPGRRRISAALRGTVPPNSVIRAAESLTMLRALDGPSPTGRMISVMRASPSSRMPAGS
jgi:hypothetical protein